MARRHRWPGKRTEMYVISLLLGAVPAARALRKPGITHLLLLNNQLRKRPMLRWIVRRRKSSKMDLIEPGPHQGFLLIGYV